MSAAVLVQADWGLDEPDSGRFDRYNRYYDKQGV